MTTTEHEQQGIVRWLSTPAAYAHKPERVEHVQTHISHVFLAGPHVYKLKKPVRYDFLDFSTPGAREIACREELRLNRRLASDAYLEVAPITMSADGRLEIGGSGAALDWLVHMRRLPTEMTLDALCRHEALLPEHIDRLGGTLTRFYGSLAPLALAPAEYRDRCLAHARGNWHELVAVQHHLPHGMVERVHGFQLSLLLLSPELFEQRAAEGRVVEGHGDLRPEHICLGDPVTIFDCIEFSRDFRSIDIADELAFLQAECDFLGAEWVGPQLFRRYQEETGDRPPAVLVDFYKSYRACVRAKVAALRADQVQLQERERFAAEAAGRLSWADRYSAPWLKPLVIVVGGLSGTGKSTLAAALADALAAEPLRTDVVRRSMFGGESHAAAIDQGIYAAEARGQVYDELFHRAAGCHAGGISVVLDGTFAERRLLERAKALCVDPRGIFLAIECVCPADVARERIGRRLAAGRDASEARPEMHAAQEGRWEAWPGEIPQTQVDTTKALAEQVKKVVDTLRALTKGRGQ